MFRKLLTDLGGRSFLTVAGFAFFAMSIATGLQWLEGFTADHWISALKICAALITGWIAKRAVEEVGAAFGRNGK